MNLSERLSALLANPGQVLTRKRDIVYLFGEIAYEEQDDYPDGFPDDDEDVLDVYPQPPSTEQPSKASDLSAFLILERLAPSDGHCAIASAEHDQIWLGYEIKALRGKATVQDILNLRSLGVMIENDAFSMFR